VPARYEALHASWDDLLPVNQQADVLVATYLLVQAFEDQLAPSIELQYEPLFVGLME
jgi:hypothetical protein